MDTNNLAIIIIRNKTGDFFVHQRRDDKKTYPSLFGLGAGGHLKQGETPQDGATRELSEETGLSLPLKECFTLNYPENDTFYDIHIYESITDQPISPALDEWQWSGWLTKKQVDQLAADKKLCPDTAEIYQQYLLI